MHIIEVKIMLTKITLIAVLRNELTDDDLNITKKLAYLGFQCLPILFSGSGPIGLPPVPWTEKNN